ncbi:MAG: periplasmic heavy metal sensor [Myxococcota bacterium]
MTESNAEPARRNLIAWPLSLLAMTIALLLVANVLTACGGPHRDRPDLDEIKERASEGVEHLVWRLDGTDAQTEALEGIVLDAIDELAAAYGPREDVRAELSALLTADTIDRDAMEALRARHFERADRLTGIATARLADALEVLTPAQRAQLDERLDKRRRRRGWH